MLSFRLITCFKLVAIVIFIASLAQANGEPPAKIQLATDSLLPGLIQCPERTWPNPSWEKAAFIFIENEVSPGTAWFWNPQTNAFKAIKSSELDSDISHSTYSFIEYDDYATTTINATSMWMVDWVSGTAFHEAFHFIIQKNWLPPQLKGTIYPFDSRPRLYRKHIQDNFIGFYRSGDIAFLQRAKYWFNKWKKAAPSEYYSRLDSIEGSARYSERMAAVLAHHGCQVDEDLLLSTAFASVNAYPLHMMVGLEPFDSESYVLGASALIIARKLGFLNERWVESMAKGVSPLEMLLQDIDPLAEETPERMHSYFIDNASALSEKFSPLLDPQILRYNDPNYIRVEIPWHWGRGSFFSYAFLFSEELNLEMIVLGDHEFTKNETGEYLRLRKNTVQFTGDESCGGKKFVLVRKDQIYKLDANEYMIRAEHIEGLVKGSLAKCQKTPGPILQQHELLIGLDPTL